MAPAKDTHDSQLLQSPFTRKNASNLCVVAGANVFFTDLFHLVLVAVLEETIRRLAHIEILHF